MLPCFSHSSKRKNKLSSLLFNQSRSRVDISSSEVETYFTSAADPLTFAQRRSALCSFFVSTFYCFMFALGGRRRRRPVLVPLDVLYVVMSPKTGTQDTFLSMHVFISQLALHHDARPSVPARRLNSMPTCCRVMRKQTDEELRLTPRFPEITTLKQFEPRDLTCVSSSGCCARIPPTPIVDFG